MWLATKSFCILVDWKFTVELKTYFKNARGRGGGPIPVTKISENWNLFILSQSNYAWSSTASFIKLSTFSTQHFAVWKELIRGNKMLIVEKYVVSSSTRHQKLFWESVFKKNKCFNWPLGEPSKKHFSGHVR